MQKKEYFKVMEYLRDILSIQNKFKEALVIEKERNAAYISYYEKLHSDRIAKATELFNQERNEQKIALLSKNLQIKQSELQANELFRNITILSHSQFVYINRSNWLYRCDSKSQSND